jgi:pimeloyl-ACP methyl ester carboxylesterase
MELVHDRRGTGEPLVLLHGLGSRWQAWNAVLDRLAEHHEVLAVDMPGFGASPPMPAGRRADNSGLTRAVADWIADQGLDRPHVAGNSTGGGIALELAAQGAVASATAIAPIGFWSRRERQFCQASLGLDRVLIGALGPLALQGVLEGEAAIPRTLAAKVIEEFRERGRRRRLPLIGSRGAELTSREWEVLHLMADGLSTSQLAARLNISQVTVRRHVSSILHKLQVPDRDTAVRLVSQG